MLIISLGFPECFGFKFLIYKIYRFIDIDQKIDRIGFENNLGFSEGFMVYNVAFNGLLGSYSIRYCWWIYGITFVVFMWNLTFYGRD